MPKLPDMSAAAVRRRQALAKAAKAPKIPAKAQPRATKRGAKRG